jgi:hypothetical protein
MQKFNRVYELKVEADDQVRPSQEVAPSNTKNVTIGLPYTIEFEITRANLGSAQSATFRIYNLGLETRRAIQKDQWQFIFRAIQFRAGYQSPEGTLMPLLFNGVVRTAYSYRQGVDFITEIEAYDSVWSMTQGFTSLAIPGGITASQIIAWLAKDLPNTSGTPIIGNFPTVAKRGIALSGNTWNLIQRFTNQLAIMNNGRLIALKLNEVLKGGLPLISAETGLLGVPKRTRSMLECQMIFEPRLTLCQLIELRTITLPELNRFWKVVGIQHRGMISPTVSGDCTSTATLWYTDVEFQEIFNLGSL